MTCDLCDQPPSLTRWTPTGSVRLCPLHDPTPELAPVLLSDLDGDDRWHALHDGWVA